jgi:hypothetical protein
MRLKLMKAGHCKILVFCRQLHELLHTRSLRQIPIKDLHHVIIKTTHRCAQGTHVQRPRYRGNRCRSVDFTRCRICHRHRNCALPPGLRKGLFRNWDTYDKTKDPVFNLQVDVAVKPMNAPIAVEPEPKHSNV